MGAKVLIASHRYWVAILLLLGPATVSWGQGDRSAAGEGSDNWRHRFADPSTADQVGDKIADRRIDVRPSTAPFRPPKLRLPDLESTRIDIPKPRPKTPGAAAPLDKATAPAARVASRTPAPLKPDFEQYKDAASQSLASPDPLADPYRIRRTQFGDALTPFDGTRSFLPTLQNAERFWIRAEYLYWLAESLRTPALVTTSNVGTPAFDQPGTSVLFGQRSQLNEWESGYRLTVGLGIDRTGRFRLEGEYLRIFDRSEQVSFASNDPTNPTNVIGRPFFDTATGTEQAQVVSLAGVASGNVTTELESRLRSWGLYGRASTCRAPGPCEPIGPGAGLNNRFDFLIGYRYANLEDVININENVTGLNAGNDGSVFVPDSFQTDNLFRGVELGMVYYGTWNRFSTEFITRLAVGTNHQTVFIGGFTDTTQAGVTTRNNGGLLAQRTNIGTYDRNEFAILPQLGLTLGGRLMNNWTFKFGYHLFYMSNVVRAGDQIDTDVNSGLFPPETPVVTSGLRPRFPFRESDYWAHGFTLGTDLRF